MAVVRNEHAAAASAVGPTATPAAIPTATLADKARPDFSADSPETFVHTLWPHAERAARELGTVPEILIAQAALETGWGQSLPRGAGDAPSFNLFGIKADAAWTGPRAMVNTLEFIDGVPEPRREPFRVYQSVGESFTDYVKLIRTRPRYREALDAGSPAAYARALQSAGYATDPDYADKLIGILERGLPGHALRGGRHQVVTLAADKPAGGAILDATGELEGS